MNDLRTGEQRLLEVLSPASLIGALIYFALFIAVAALLARGLRAAVHAAIARQGHIDRTTVNFLQQFGSVLIWVMALILYAHLIPVLRAMGTALLAGAGVASVVIGLAAQSTLGNLVAGISITIYKPFRLGDTLQVAAPTGTEVGVVDAISLGDTTLRTADGRSIVLPNSLAASQVCINLNDELAAGRMTVAIRTPRDVDIEAVRELAMHTALESIGAQSACECRLTRIEASAAVFTLEVSARSATPRETRRSRLLAELARSFTSHGIGEKAAERPSFS